MAYSSSELNDYSYCFSEITIIESIPSGERQTGTELFYSVIEPLASQQRLRSKILQVKSAAEIVKQIDAMAVESARERSAPSIHLEMHGDEHGLRASDGSIATWTDLKAPLQRLNSATRFNLAVTLACCSGAHLLKCLTPIEPAPVCLFIGPGGPVWNSVVADGFKIYFRMLLQARNGREAWLALNEIARIDGQLFEAWPARYYFRRLFEKYFIEQLSPQMQLRRVDEMFAQLAAEGSVLLRDGLAVRTQLLLALTDREYWIHKYADLFFMLDLYPSNRARLGVDADAFRVP